MDSQVSPALQQRLDRLVLEIETFRRHFFRHRRMNYITYASLVLLGLAASVAITVAGILNLGLYAAILGVCVGFIQGIQQIFPMNEKAEFYRLIVAESENLIDDLKYRVLTDDELKSILTRFQTLREHAAAALPKGQGMDTVKKMYDDLASRKITGGPLADDSSRHNVNTGTT